MAINQWDKGSTNNGPNAHKKGNRVKGQPRQGKTLTEASKAYSDHITHYKKLAEERRKASPYRQEEAINIYSRLQQYIEDKTAEDKPITVSGLILAARCSSDTWRRMQSGDYDYRLYEYIDMYNVDMDSITEFLDGFPVFTDAHGNKILLTTYGNIVQKALLQLQEQTETRLYEKGRVGDIFALKAQHGWQEDNTPQTVNQTLVIASPEEAERAIKMLK